MQIKDERLKQKKEKQTRWKTNNKEAWKRYLTETTNNKELDQTWRNEENIQQEWEKWKNIMYKILNKTFGKVRITNNKKQGIDKEVKEMMKEKREVRRKANKTTDQEEKLKKEEERRIIEQKIKRRIEEIEEQRLDEVTMRLNDKINNYDILWKLKKTAQRKQESTFVIKDKNGNDIKVPDEIKDKVSEHYDNLYTNNEVQEGYRE